MASKGRKNVEYDSHCLYQYCQTISDCKAHHLFVALIFILILFVLFESLFESHGVQLKCKQSINKSSGDKQLSIIKNLFEIEWPKNDSSTNVYFNFIHPLHNKWDEILEQNRINVGQHNSAEFIEETIFYIEQIQNMIRYKEKNNLTENVLVCEIGYNMGHSAMTYLFGGEGISNKIKTNYLSFSYPIKNHQLIAKKMKDTFKVSERLHVFWGDSTKFIPYYIQLKRETNQLHQCDIVIVDGGHKGDTPYIDINNMAHLANKQHHVLIVDDLQCIELWCKDVVAAWNKLTVQKKRIKELGCWGNKERTRGWCWGKYNFDNRSSSDQKVF